ncbi:MAG: hypothetical protein RLZZ488_1676 [Pseudomonadota bacterium]|jgi:hypothetical protein
MTKTNFTRLCLFAAVAASATLDTGCQRSSHTSSEVNFARTSETTALLESRDLSDKFLFGLNVIDSKGFYGTALNLNFRPVETDLVLAAGPEGKPQLFISTAGSDGRRQKLLSFDVREKGNGRFEVDFNTAGNDLSLWNDIGGSTVDVDAGIAAGSWQTVAQPRVVKVVQDPDTVIVDIVHSVSFALAKDSSDNTASRSGEVKIRLFLKRQVKDPQIINRTAKMARLENIGFFPSARTRSMDGELPIAHYKLDVESKRPAQQIIYLKDFPKEYESVGKQAIESWNISFGFDAFKTEIASEDMDLGDPRYNVVKWIDGLDQEVPWAGYAPTMVNPLTGEVVSTQILINGSTTRKSFEEIYRYTAEASPQFSKLSGKIGNVPLVEGTGENPVVSFFADGKSKSEEEYVKGYYFSVIMHEFGHSLGLRHNFAASTRIDANGISSSVMDYEPGFVTNIRREPGSYDTAAVRWGYFGESPKQQQVFCTDEDLSKRYDCNQGDVGRPQDFVVTGIIQGTSVLENLIVPLPDMVKKPMKGMMKTALKILELAEQLPAAERNSAVNEISRALERARNAKAADGLSAAEKAIVEANLSKLAASYADVTAPKPPAPIALTPGW